LLPIQKFFSHNFVKRIWGFLGTNRFLYLLGAFLLLISLILWQVQDAHYKSQLISNSRSTARTYTSEAESRYNRIIDALEILASQGAPIEPKEISDWKKDAIFYIDTFEGLNTIIWIDNNLRVREIQPNAKSDFYPQGLFATDITTETSELFIWIPCENGVVFTGYMLGIVSLEDFVSPIIDELENNYMLRISRELETVYITKNWQPVDEQYEVSHLATLKDTTSLNFSLAPTQAMINKASSYARNTLFFSLFLSILTLLAVYLAQNYNAIALLTERRYRNLFEASQDAIFLVDKQGVFKDANPAATKLVGYSLAELKQKTFHEIQFQNASEHREGVSLFQEESGKDERLIQHKQGHSIPVDLLYSPVTAAQEQKYTLILARDITERKWAEAEIKAYSEQLEEKVIERTHALEEAQEKIIQQERLAVLGELAGGVAHELRNPLGVITNAIYYLQITLGDIDESGQKYLTLIEKEAKNAAKIISDLLDYTHINKGKRIDCQISTLIDPVINFYPYPQNINIELSIPDDIPTIHVDPQQINKVLTNLITNAYQSMPEGGQIQISAIELNNEVQVSISDEGSGIKPEHREKIFEPLFTTKARGIGLGLATSQKLMKINNGYIDFTSQPGEGSTFRLHFPLSL